MSDASTRTTEGLAKADVLSEAKRALLAKKIAERAAQQEGIPARSPAAEYVPLTGAQEEIWLLEQLSPGLTAYNLANAWRVRGVFDELAFQRAVNTVVARHESLRAQFVSTSSGPEQRFAPPGEVAVLRADASHSVDPGSEGERVVREWGTTPFNLSSDTLLRAGIVRLSADERIVFVMMHHLAVDAVSRGLVFDELSSLYAAYTSNGATELANVRVPYGDYATWEKSQSVASRFDAQEQFWLKQLEGAPDALDLPLDRPRGSSASFAAGRSSRTLPHSQLSVLKEFANTHRATPFQVLLSAFSAILARYSGQDDLVIGVPSAARSRNELTRAVGLYANTLGIRARFAPQQKFSELLEQLRSATLDAFENQDIPFNRVSNALRKAGRPANAPVFQVMFAMQNHGASQLAFAGAVTEPLGIDVGSTKFDLTLVVAERPEGLRMTLEYRTDLFDGSTADRMLRHLERLLLSALHDPSTAVTGLALMDEEERQLVTETWNATSRSYPDTTLDELFDQQCERTPDAVALSFEGQTLSYREMRARVRNLATALTELGVRPGVLVAVAAERSFDLVIALHAVARAGGAYVPLDPEYPADRLTFMLQDSAPQVLLTQRDLVECTPRVVPEFDGPTLYIDSVSGPRTVSASQTAAAPDDAAYMIYTSGSTGRPKGALNAHRGIVNRLLWMQEQYQLTASDVVLQKTPYSFDVSVWEFFWPLIVGARLAIAKPGGHRDPAYLLDLIQSEQVTTLHFVPSMLRAFLAGISPERAAHVASLRHMMCSGEALPHDLVAGVRSAMPHVALHNLYGPTECAVDVSHWTCGSADAEPGANVPIGKPVSNTQLYVLDSNLQTLPVGVPGELYLAGVQVGLGYHGRPELTAERFVTNIFSDNPSARMYRTGDRARWRKDGVVEYLGRLDDQIKLRGFRIELGEIASTMQQHPAISDAAAVLRPERGGIVVGYAVAGDLTEASRERVVRELKSLLSQQLPDYMVPASLVLLDRLPLTASGKLDRRSLPAPVFDDAADAEPPLGPIEEVIAAVWRQALSVPFVGRTTNFFNLGGHSLIMTTMIAALARLLRTQLPLRAAFEAPTVQGMAAAFESREAKPGQMLKIATIVNKLQSGAPAGASAPDAAHKADNNTAGLHAQQ